MITTLEMEGIDKMFVLIEMVKSKSYISKLLEAKTDVYIAHLLKIYFYRTHPSFEYWISEISSFITSIPLLKGIKRLPSHKFIVEHTYGWISENVEGITNCFIIDNLDENNPDAYGKECLNYNKDNFRKFIESYFDEFANRILKNKGYISRTQVSEIVNGLLNKS